MGQMGQGWWRQHVHTTMGKRLASAPVRRVMYNGVRAGALGSPAGASVSLPDGEGDGRAGDMEPEELDLVELREDVAVQDGWRMGRDVTLEMLRAGARGMVIHRHEGESRRYDVEFVDPRTSEPMVLATLDGDKLRVVERDTLGSS